MKRLLILLVTSFVCNFTYGKDNTDLNRYYYNINLAESALLDSNYKLAVKSYCRAFTRKSSPFIKDRFNLAICYAILNKYDKCYTQLVYVVNKGGSIHQLQKRNELAGFFTSTYGNELIKFAQTHTPNINLQYRKVLDSLVYMDQQFRETKGGYDLYGDTIRIIDSLNVITLNQLIARYGFPSEDIVGVDTSLQLFRPFYNVLFIHQQLGAQNRFWDYTALVTQAADCGELEIHAAAEYIWKFTGKDNLGVMNGGLVQLILDTSQNAIPNNFKAERGNAPYGYFKMTPEKEQMINLKRDSLGLETLTQARQKTAFVQVDRRFLLPSSTVSVLVCTSTEQYEKMSKSLIWIE